jgi:hypothetical protein
MKKSWFGWMADWQGTVLLGLFLALWIWGIEGFLYALGLSVLFGIFWAFLK